MNNKKAILFLLFLGWIFPEILSGNTSPLSLVTNPAVWLFNVLGYGVALLFFHELVIKYNLSPRMTLMLGLVYGLFNEGVLAKTLTNSTNCCGVDFHGYGTFFGFHFGLAFLLLFWHAIFAVLFNLILVKIIFAEQAERLWFTEKGYKRLKIILCILWLVYFLLPNIDKTRPKISYFIWYVIFAAILIWLALRKNSSQELTSKNVNLLNKNVSEIIGYPACLGVITAFLLLLTNQAHSSGLPFFSYAVLMLGMAGGLMYISRSWRFRPEWFRFTLAGYIFQSLFIAIMFVFINPFEGAIRLAVSGGIAIWFMVLLKKEKGVF